jgi:TPP-dependent pyruvate/acetoin dehydrogenase alpha subunit
LNNPVQHLHITPAHLLREGFHRQLNIDALQHAPKIYIIHNQGHAAGVPLPLAFANPCLIDLAPAYRLRGARITSEEQLQAVLPRAEGLCAAHHGPFIIEYLLETTHD